MALSAQAPGVAGALMFAGAAGCAGRDSMVPHAQVVAARASRRVRGPGQDADSRMSPDTGPAADEHASEGEIAALLVRRIAAGDGAAEAALVERYSRGLRFLLRRMGVLPALAEDLQQETFRIALERLRRRGLEQPERLAGFLCGTLRKLAAADRRKTLRRRTEGVDPLDLAATEDPAPSQLSAMLHEEHNALVRQMIGELQTDRDRQILLRYYVGEEDKGRICADLGLASVHFNRVLFRARQRFKELLTRGGVRA